MPSNKGARINSAMIRAMSGNRISNACRKRSESGMKSDQNKKPAGVTTEAAKITIALNVTDSTTFARAKWVRKFVMFPDGHILTNTMPILMLTGGSNTRITARVSRGNSKY